MPDMETIYPPPNNIQNAVVTGGNLWLTLTDGTQYNAGPVLGPVNRVNALAYQTAAPTSGATVAMASGVAVLYITGTLLALLTVSLPPSPIDGQLVRVTAASGITLMTVKDASGTTLATSLGLGTLGTSLWQYQSTIWVRLQ